MRICTCGHDEWDHEYEESFNGETEESYFLKCEVDNCKCDAFEENEK